MKKKLLLIQDYHTRICQAPNFKVVILEGIVKKEIRIQFKKEVGEGGIFLVARCGEERQ